MPGPIDRVLTPSPPIPAFRAAPARQGARTPMHLDAILVDEDVTGGQDQARPGASRTSPSHRLSVADSPGLLDAGPDLAFPYRWSTRAICLTSSMRPGAERIRRQCL
jgi:type IV secretion system protein VirB4